MITIRNSEERKTCPMRHNNGNCLPLGGFCMDSINDDLCHAMRNAYEHGRLDERLLNKVRNASAEDIVDAMKLMIHSYDGEYSNLAKMEKAAEAKGENHDSI
jgi:hypothetical protein